MLCSDSLMCTAVLPYSYPLASDSNSMSLLPPGAFWSLTLYVRACFTAANSTPSIASGAAAASGSGSPPAASDLTTTVLAGGGMAAWVLKYRSTLTTMAAGWISGSPRDSVPS